MFVAAMIVILKLVTSTKPVTLSEFSMSTLKRYDTEKNIYQDSNDTFYRQNIDTEITDNKLMAFARAFVKVQSYMNQAGNRTSYEVTRKIVQNYGLSVADYTNIATQMNADPGFQSRVLEMINEIN